MTNPKRFIQRAFFSVILLLYINPSVVCAKNGGAKMIIKCIEKERQALLKFQQGLVDDSGRLISWGSKDCCTWSGVHCNNITGHVVALDLHNQYYAFLPLTGIISPSLLQLQHLNYLDLSSNYFGDTEIPEFIGSLTQLQYLNLAENNFVGEISYHFGNLTKLRFLDLGFNVLTVMNLVWLPNLRMLSYLDMSSVNFTNVNWLQAVNNLSFLRELRLSMCGLSGVTPVSIPLTNSSSMNLAVVDLSENGYVSFSEFRWLFNFSSSLVDIDISSNSLRGPIPDAFGDIVSLTNLNLASNALEGEIPESFGKMLSLTSLYLRDNLLEGEIPVSFGRNLSHLQLLELSGNNFRGQLHDFLKGLSGVATSSLESLRLADNQLSGSLPDITNFSALTTLSLRIN